MQQQVPESVNLKLGLYCHVPFCANKCSYCSFYKTAPTKQAIENYLCGIEKELNLLNISAPFDTIYLGGGTPGILQPKHMERLCRSMLKNNSKDKVREFSIEFSPQTVSHDKIDILLAYGCNRITLGVQSFNEKTLQALGRFQSQKQVYQAYEILFAAGIKNLGIDLIFGSPNQTLDEWLEDLQKTIALQPQHISTYNLTFEDNTFLQHQLANGKIAQKSEEEEVEFYSKTCQFLLEHDYLQYEVSNFCHPGFESQHNCATWLMNDWIGIGPSACSQYKMKRLSNFSTIEIWLQHLKNDALPYFDVENISDEQMMEDSIIFGLRMNQGINFTQLKSKYHHVDCTLLEALLCDLQTEKYITMSDDTIKLTNKGRLVADSISKEIVNILCL